MSAATSHELEEHIEEARHTLGDELEKFATNTLQYLKREHHLATDSPDLPHVRTSFKDRHALVVVRGIDYREDLAALKRSGYLREVKPVTIGVDGGADAPARAGHQARHHHGRLRLGVRRGHALRRGAHRARLPRRQGARVRIG